MVRVQPSSRGGLLLVWGEGVQLFVRVRKERGGMGLALLDWRENKNTWLVGQWVDESGSIKIPMVRRDEKSV